MGMQYCIPSCLTFFDSPLLPLHHSGVHTLALPATTRFFCCVLSLSMLTSLAVLFSWETEGI